MSEQSKTDLLNVVTFNQHGEPLHTVRPRYYENLRRGSRGVRASFKLVTGKTSKYKSSQSALSDQVRSELMAESGQPYADFLITSMNYAFTEKIQLTQVFGDHTVAYAFGSTPLILNINGVVTDDIDNNWFTKFIYLYKDFIRGTQLARNFELARLATHNALFEGVVMGISLSHDAGNDALVPFQMQFLVRSFEFYSAQQFRPELLDQSAEALASNIDGSFSFKDQKMAALKEQLDSKKNPFQDPLLGLSGQGSFSSVTKFAQQLQKLDPSVNSAGATISPAQASLNGTATIHKGEASFANVEVPVQQTSGIITKVFDGLNEKLAKYNNSIMKLKVVGFYADTVTSLNTSVDSIGGFLGEAKRNLEAFNNNLSYTPDPFSDLTNVLKKSRAQVKTYTDIVSILKRTEQLLRTERNPFQDVEATFADLKRDLKNAKGSVCSISTSSSNKLSASLRSSGDESFPFIGNSRAGISAADAALKLKAIPAPTVAESISLPALVTSDRTTTDARSALIF